MLEINSRITIPDEEFQVSYVRSSGPGGQNVNKVATKAVVRWDVTATESLPADVKARFLAKFGKRLTVEGCLLVTSQRYRSQERNLTDCYEKISDLVMQVAQPPKTRRPTAPSKASVRRRLENKKRTSQRKSDRRGPSSD